MSARRRQDVAARRRVGRGAPALPSPACGGRLGGGSPSGAPPRRLPKRPNAPAQPRPRFTRAGGRRRYPHRRSRLSGAPRAPVVVPEGTMPGPPEDGSQLPPAGTALAPSFGCRRRRPFDERDLQQNVTDLGTFVKQIAELETVKVTPFPNNREGGLLIKVPHRITAQRRVAGWAHSITFDVISRMYPLFLKRLERKLIVSAMPWDFSRTRRMRKQHANAKSYS